MKRVLITGCTGYIGSILAAELHKSGYEVVGVSQNNRGLSWIKSLNLLDEESCITILSSLNKIDVVIHAAAIAHTKLFKSNQDIFTENIRMTKNLLTGLKNHNPHWIYLSSMSVYGDLDGDSPIQLDPNPVPATKYGASKLASEKFLISSLPCVDIFRLAPVFDCENLTNISKRVYFPKTSIRVELCPPPSYSFSPLRLVIDNIIGAVARGGSGKNIYHLVDKRPYCQSEIIGWFSGPKFLLPIVFLLPLKLLLLSVPGLFGYKLRFYFQKLFSNNIYAAGEITLN